MKKARLMYLQDIDILSYYARPSEGEDNKQARQRMQRALQHAVQNELTQRQRDCLKLYYYENKSVVEIAEYYQLNRSTVSRHLQAAKKRLHRVLQYCLYS